MERRPDVGIAGSRLEEPDGTPQRSAFRFPTVLGELERGLRLGAGLAAPGALGSGTPPVPDGEGPTDWVAGASMIVRREVFEAIGLLDEGYFMYFEEVDFCLGRPGRLALLVRPDVAGRPPGRPELGRDQRRASSGGGGRATGSRPAGATSSPTTGASGRCWPTWPGPWPTPPTGLRRLISASPTSTRSGCSGTSSATTSSR